MAAMGRAALVFTILAVEFVDELVFGVREAAWPLIRDELTLSYTQIGALLSIPGVIGNILEPALALAGDVWNKRHIILVNGLLMALAIGYAGDTGRSFASGGFVSLSEAHPMDLSPDRHEKNMARWSVAGAIGTGALAITQWTRDHESTPRGYRSIGEGVAGALSALRSASILRWLALLQISDLMLDVLFGFIALYFVDVAGSDPALASISVAVWTGGGLAGSLLLVKYIEKLGGAAPQEESRPRRSEVRVYSAANPLFSRNEKLLATFSIGSSS